jgi:hypothetical protein
MLSSRSETTCSEPPEREDGAQVAIAPAKVRAGRLIVRLVSEGKWNANVDEENSC